MRVMDDWHPDPIVIGFETLQRRVREWRSALARRLVLGACEATTDCKKGTDHIIMGLCPKPRDLSLSSRHALQSGRLSAALMPAPE
jgi:hypothetical protein